jgi:peroxiredoxin
MPMRSFILCVLFAANTFLNFAKMPAAEGVPSHTESLIGTSVADFTLKNCYGKSVSLTDFDDCDAIAIVFLGTECPLAKLYGPRLTDIQNHYREKGKKVQVIGVNSNNQDSLTEMVAYVTRHEIDFPMLKDLGNQVADAMGAKRTPEVFLIDGDRKVRYHGRIDDQYGVGYSREREAEPELRIAIDQLLAGKEIENPVTEAVGCHIGRIKKVESIGDITFTKHIAPILNNHCVSCHRPGEIAPFTLTSYDDVLGWEDTILEVIADNRMPPWYADPDHGSFANDPRLSDHERELISTWVDNGMPEGDASDWPPAPEFADGWRIGEPDVVISMNENKQSFTVPAEGVVEYQYFEVDPGWTEDMYVVAAEARPGNRSVVHHIIAFVIPPGKRRPDLRQMVVGYAPGSVPLQTDEGVALRVEAGSKLLFEMHYTPNGSVQEDLSKIGLRFTDKKNVKKMLRGRIAINTKFEIQPENANEVVKATYKTKSDELLLSLTQHMLII